MNKQLWFLPLLLSMFFNRLSAQIQVTDLLSKDSDKNSMPRNFVQFNNLLFFEAITESYGKEIWVSDGTVDNTRLLKDIYPGKSSGITTVFSQSSVTFNDKLFFVANDGQNGKQIWSTDGTDLIFTGKSNNDETALLKLNPENYQVEEIKELITNVNQPFFTRHFNINLISKITDNSFYIAPPTYIGDQEGWVYDLTESNLTVVGKVTNAREIISYGGDLYFSGYAEDTGYELWKSDNAFNNPGLFLNINQSKFGLASSQYTMLEDKIFFRGNDGITGYELWVYNNSTNATYQVKDIYDGDESSFPYNITRHNGHVYFSANVEGMGYELWRSDGSESGTTMVSDLNEGANSSFPGYMTVGLGKLFFVALVNDHYFLCSANETGTELIKDFGENIYGSPFNVNELVSTDDGLYFILTGAGESLWKSDGTESGTIKIKQFAQITNLTVADEKVYFSAIESYPGESELWQSDGSDTGTKMVKDIGEGYSSSPRDFKILNDALVFTAYTEESGREFWKSDGTSDGTLQIADINPGNAGSADKPRYAELDGWLYFAANDGTHGIELWKTDGTPGVASIVRDINEGANGSYPTNW